ncbi:MAG: MrtC family glutamic-type intramembrane protease [Polyangiaceae bacterium]
MPIDVPKGASTTSPERRRAREPRERADTPTTSAKSALATTLLTTLFVTITSYFAPDEWAATAVGAIFLVVTYWRVVHGSSDARVRHHGIAFGGLLETRPLEWRRLLLETTKASSAALVTALVVFPPFAFGFLLWWQPESSFQFRSVSRVVADALGQLLVVALPEEVFYRGYLQTSLDDAWKSRVKLFGGTLSPGLVVTSAIFALGHVLTEPNPSRLAVFFPSLLFGWLRTRTRGVGASVGFHALSNLYSAYLGRCFGMWS